MSIWRRAARRDANERDIIEALEAVGATVWQVSGKGKADLVVGYRGTTHVMEVKKPGEGLTPAQMGSFAAWRGSPVRIVESKEDALRVLGILTATRRL